MTTRHRFSGCLKNQPQTAASETTVMAKSPGFQGYSSWKRTPGRNAPARSGKDSIDWHGDRIIKIRFSKLVMRERRKP